MIIYQSITALSKLVKDVSFEVNEGEVVTLIGANGAGKTSILRTISGLVRPSAGKIEFLGQEIQKKNLLEKSLLVACHRFLKDVMFSQA